MEEEFTKNFWLGLLAFQFTQDELDEVPELPNESCDVSGQKMENEFILAEMFNDIMKILLNPSEQHQAE